jgi:hypothetical protein
MAAQRSVFAGTTTMDSRATKTYLPVIPAKAGIQYLLYERRWVPAFAGTTIFWAVSAMAHS